MSKSNKIILGVGFVFLIIYFLLTGKYIDYHILNIQAYVNESFVFICFILFLTSVFAVVLRSDSGFMKIGAVFGIFFTVFTLAFNLANPQYEYETLSSDQYDLIIKTEEIHGSLHISVYQREDVLFSEYVDKIVIDDHYETTLMIEANMFVIIKCTDLACQREELTLN